MTRLGIIQRLQSRIGDEPIRTEEDPGADALVAIFDDVRDDLLSRYPWTFATVVRRQPRLQAVPETRYPYYYQLPSDMIGAPRAVYRDCECRHSYTNFDIFENRLATDAQEVFVKYTRCVPMIIWPGYFRELFNTVVMSEFALSIREDGVLSDRLRVRAFGTPAMMGEGGLLGQAKNQDAQSHGAVVLTEGSNPLIDVRTS